MIGSVISVHSNPYQILKRLRIKWNSIIPEGPEGIEIGMGMGMEIQVIIKDNSHQRMGSMHIQGNNHKVMFRLIQTEEARVEAECKLNLEEEA